MKNSQVVMFPGLGAQYPQMVEKYLAAFPEDLARYNTWRDAIGVRYEEGRPLSAYDRERQRQFDIHALNLLWWKRVGDRYDDAVFCGHSLGAYAALVAAGSIDEVFSFRMIDKVLKISWTRFDHNPKAVFVVTTKEDCLFDELAGRLDAEILSENNARQRVMYAERTQYERLLQSLGDNLLAAVELGTNVPFHSKEMLLVKDALDAALDPYAQDFGNPRRQVWSHISARWVSDERDAFKLIAGQPYQRVRWTRLIDNLIQAGRTEFVEVGPNRILSQIVRWISPKLTVQFVDNLRR